MEKCGSSQDIEKAFSFPPTLGKFCKQWTMEILVRQMLTPMWPPFRICSKSLLYTIHKSGFVRVSAVWTYASSTSRISKWRGGRN